MFDFSFLLFLIHFRFFFVHSLSVFLFFFVFISLFDRINLKNLSTLLAAQLVFFHCSAAKRILRQTITACDRIKHSIDEYDDVFDENIRFSMYIEISESRGISFGVYTGGTIYRPYSVTKHMTLYQGIVE